jgi:NADPH:quinone reductase-like Zn-dependent oxidoreductase
MDLFQREGRYPVPPGVSQILGVEFSGHIEALGPDADASFFPGDAVFGLAYGGAYAEHIAVSTRMLLHKPAHLSWEQAAGVPEVWITATQALHFVGGFEAGRRVLWHAGASGVSIAGIQLARAAGASEIYVTAGSQEKIDFCVKELGATAGFNYKTQDWAAEVVRATGGKGVDLVVDFVGPAYFQGNLDVAARDGRIVNLGFMSGTKLPAGIDMSALLIKRLRVEGSSLRSRDEEYQGRLRDKLEESLPKFEDGTFKLYVEKVIPWENVIEAHQLMETNATKGKIICTIE